MTPFEKMMQAANRLAKWRSVFAGWQLGTRLDTDPECRAVRDNAERTLLLRAEVSAITRILIEKGVVGAEEVFRVFEDEYNALSQDLETRFPGAQATDQGMQFDIQKWAETTQGWLP